MRRLYNQGSPPPGVPQPPPPVRGPAAAASEWRGDDYSRHERPRSRDAAPRIQHMGHAQGWTDDAPHTDRTHTSGRSGPRSRSSQAEDRMLRQTERLLHVKRQLKGDSARVYDALQKVLKRFHDAPKAFRPDFRQELQDELGNTFGFDRNVVVTQITGRNQWEVRVEQGPPIFCSVRLEVLSDGDDPELVQKIKLQARAVKDKLQEQNSAWKVKLERDLGGFAQRSPMWSRFEEECRNVAKKIQEGAAGYGASYGAGGSGSTWVPAGSRCPHCKKPKEENQLMGNHMCVVVAAFTCRHCSHQWTSYHGRLDCETDRVATQYCSKCRGEGYSEDWTLPEPERGTWQQEKLPQAKGQHLSELCQACREFGNCMGIFYEPFVLSMALSLLNNKPVQWYNASQDVPELLIANVENSEAQVCLQPHVFVRTEDNEDSDNDDRDLYSRSTHRASRGPVAQPPPPRSVVSRTSSDGRRDVDYSRAPPAKAAGGVKDRGLLDSMLAGHQFLAGPASRELHSAVSGASSVASATEYAERALFQAASASSPAPQLSTPAATATPAAVAAVASAVASVVTADDVAPPPPPRRPSVASSTAPSIASLAHSAPAAIDASGLTAPPQSRQPPPATPPPPPCTVQPPPPERSEPPQQQMELQPQQPQQVQQPPVLQSLPEYPPPPPPGPRPESEVSVPVPLPPGPPLPPGLAGLTPTADGLTGSTSSYLMPPPPPPPAPSGGIERPFSLAGPAEAVLLPESAAPSVASITSSALFEAPGPGDNSGAQDFVARMKASKGNKMARSPGGTALPSSPGNEQGTPLLDDIPPIRKKKLLAFVEAKVGVADSKQKAEELLRTFGSLEQATEHAEHM